MVYALKACPVINKLKENLYNIKVYACKNKDENIRKKVHLRVIYFIC